MARILLIGRGPLPSVDAPQMGFSQLRTQAFLDALTAAGHDVRLVSLVPSPSTQSLDGWSGIAEIREEGADWIAEATSLSEDAEIVVSAGPYNPGRLAVAVAGPRPLWVDIPGDPSAELAALARVTPGGLSTAQLAAAHSGAISVLSRADGISVISDAQRLATLGQLGLIGRLLSDETTPTLSTIPISGGIAGRTPRTQHRSDGRVVALAGAFNPWVDVDGLIATLSGFLDLRPDARVVCTGGGIPGFYEAGFERFKAWAETRKTRVTVHGWLPHAEMLSRLQKAHIGLSLDAPGPEPELGSRTRLLLYAELGLTPASTVRCELTQQWADAGALMALPSDSPSDAARVLAETVLDPSLAERAAALCPSASEVCKPLEAWCDAPSRCSTFRPPEAVLAEELHAVKDELARVYESPTWMAMNRLHGLGQSAVSRLKTRPK